MNPTWESDCGTVKLWLGDCLEVMASWPDGAVDAVVTDPPYGIGEAAGKNKSRTNAAVARDYGSADWDDSTNQVAIDECRMRSTQQIVFGGNYYDLPPSSCWLVWDKQNGANDFADAELAWTNLQGAVRLRQHRWNGMIRKDNEARFHPTQKPLGVMLWACGFTTGDTIADPFMGSGTTGVAAVRLGRKFWGVEIDQQYFEVAKRRIQDELAKVAFLEPQPTTKQQELFA